MNVQNDVWLRQQALQERCYHPSGQWEEFPRSALAGSIIARFEEMVSRYPNRLALKMGRQTLTYATFNAAVNQLAHTLLQCRGPQAEPVVLLFGQTIEALIALYAVLKAGKFYVPLDASYPSAQLTTMIQDTQAQLLVTNARGLAAIDHAQQQGLQILNMDTVGTQGPSTNPGLTIAPDALACIIYTSGSTGMPKGVVRSQRDILHQTLDHTNTAHICPDDRFTMVRSFSFNGAVKEIFCALLNGAAVILADLKETNLSAIAQCLQDDAITIWHSSASTFRHFAQSLDEGPHFPALRLLQIGAEPVYQADIDLFHRYFHVNCHLCTTFASSETAGSVTRFRVDQQVKFSAARVPVGYPANDYTVQLWDEQGNEVADGTIGEIVVKSAYLAQGYWRQPALTATRFLPDPAGTPARLYRTGDLGLRQADGALVHMGRADTQVKIRGQRIELIEVERALLTAGVCKEACVTTRPDGSGEPQLIAYLVPTQQPPPTISSVRDRLAQHVAAPLIPGYFVWLSALPLTAHNKIDRRSLPEPPKTRPTLAQPYVAPCTPTEITLAALWSEILEITPIGRQDRFFDLGGNSLRATQLIARIRQQFRLEIPLQHLYVSPTVADLALLMTQQQVTQIEPAQGAQLLAELEMLSEQEVKRQLLVQVIERN